MWLKTLYRKRAVTWPFIFYTIIWTLSLKEQFQISDSTLNRLIKLDNFPRCWFGIKGHYLRDDILEWIKKGKEEYFCDQFRLLREL
ncbi:hypothetical protein [Enterococcus faecium]